MVSGLDRTQRAPGAPILLALAALTAACAGAAPQSQPDASGAAGATARPGAATPTTTPISVTESRYGKLALGLVPGTACDVEVRVTPGRLGDRPVEKLAGTADAAGALVFVYAAPPLPTQPARHLISCRFLDGQRSESAPFDVTLAPLKAASFTARVAASASEGPVDRTEPSLVPLRDAAVRRIREDLAREWSAATRGLGSVRVVEEPAEILVKVVAARDPSVHVRASDGSQEVRINVADDRGNKSVENLVATTLHELGHIWCCTGPGTADGHWAKPELDGELQGIDRFGLMNHPVDCVIFGAVTSCPNRFSRRELEAFGFTSIPAPPPDPCLSQARPLESRIAGHDATLRTLRAEIDDLEARMAPLLARIKELEARYGRSMPPDVYAEYTRTVDQYNALAATHRARVDSHNATVAARNAAVAQRNALPC